MTQLKNTTQKARNYIRRYNNSVMRSLYDLYDSFSCEKKEAWDYCVELCSKLNGTNLKVCSGNIHSFTAGFKFIEDNKLKLCYITKCNDYVIDLE